MNYTVYHLHSDLSSGVTNIDSTTKFKEYVDRAKELGMKALGFSEHGSVFEWVHKKEYIESKGMKYIHGAECYLTEDISENINDNYHVILIARNEKGKSEINRLISKSFDRTDGHFYGKPRISIEELIQTSNDVIITSACLGGVLNSDNQNLRDKFLNFFINNKHRCFLEVQHHNCEEQKRYNIELGFISKKYNIPLIAGTDTHSLDEDHAYSRIMLQKAKKVHFDNEDKFDLVFKTYDELCEAYKVQGVLSEKMYLEAIENTNVLADMVEPFELNREYKYPKLYKDSEKVFKRHIYDGLIQRGIDKYPNYDNYIERIKEEISTFKHNNAVDFMLLDEDYKKYCRENKIGYGYSRGSVSGSIVAYCLNITDIDSVKEKLNFSRFMNTERVSLADIDTDFYSEDIPKVKDYLFNKEGLYCCDIITFNTIALKGAVKDMGRALEMPLSEVENINKVIDTDEENCRKKYPELFKLVDMVSGTIVSVGNHPAGVVVSPFPLDDWFGTFSSKTDPYPISQINMKEIDSLNFVKLDLLKLDNVGLINETCRLAGIERLTPDNTPEDDINVWRSIRDDTTCIFQWESDSASKYLKELFSEATITKIKEINPNISYMDLLSVGNGAIRPAGASYRNELASGIFRDNGHPALNKMLNSTLGYLVYQEQVIEFLHKFCGYTMGQADIVRRGFAKKTGTDKFIPDIKKGFIKTMKEYYDTPEEESEKIIINFLRVIEDASDYLFSENHAKPYSWIGYICGYLRYYYPVEFFTAALNIFSDKNEKTVAITEYLKNNNISLSSIKFRKSRDGYFFDKEECTIYKGLNSVKSLNQNVGVELYKLKDNKYRNFAEFLYDADQLKIGTSNIESLIRLDFFSEFGNVGKLLAILEYYEKYKKNKTLRKAVLTEDQIKIARQCSNIETEKMFREVCMKEFIICSIQYITPKCITLTETINDQLRLLGYIEYTNDKLDKIVVVMDVNLRYSPLVTIYSLSKGGTINIKISKKVYNDNPINVGDIIKISEFQKKNKQQYINGEYHPVPNSYDWWVNKYVKVKI